jgi:hypothetical protein
MAPGVGGYYQTDEWYDAMPKSTYSSYQTVDDYTSKDDGADIEDESGSNSDESATDELGAPQAEQIYYTPRDHQPTAAASPTAEATPANRRSALPDEGVMRSSTIKDYPHVAPQSVQQGGAAPAQGPSLSTFSAPPPTAAPSAVPKMAKMTVSQPATLPLTPAPPIPQPPSPVVPPVFTWTMGRPAAPRTSPQSSGKPTGGRSAGPSSGEDGGDADAGVSAERQPPASDIAAGSAPTIGPSLKDVSPAVGGPDDDGGDGDLRALLNDVEAGLREWGATTTPYYLRLEPASQDDVEAELKMLTEPNSIATAASPPAAAAGGSGSTIRVPGTEATKKSDSGAATDAVPAGENDHTSKGYEDAMKKHVIRSYETCVELFEFFLPSGYPCEAGEKYWGALLALFRVRNRAAPTSPPPSPFPQLASAPRRLL